MNNFDLHNHSTFSDGMLSPEALVDLAVASGCDCIALTDHDTTAGVSRARAAAQGKGLKFVPGVEISVSWPGKAVGQSAGKPSRDQTIHIVGLGVDENNAQLSTSLQDIRTGRMERARRMADQFKAIGIHDMLEGALKFSDNPDMIARTHFARYLVERGVVREVGQAFGRFMTYGKLGYVEHEWASLSDALAWIKAAGGVAVLAHPGRYKIMPEELEALIAQFKTLGGDAIEVVTGSHSPEQYKVFSKLARKYSLEASRGADFHSIGESPYKPGELPPLDASLTPVWRGVRQDLFQ
jgi:3',5'-nucleoside bisphosphate phosphatase